MGRDQKLKKQLEKKPKKTSWNSSLPPARGFKAEVRSEKKESSKQRTGSSRMKKLLLRAFVLQKRWSDLAETTRYQYRCRLY